MWRNWTDLASLHLAGAFATTGTMSGTWFVATGEVLSLSEQQIVDGSWDHDVNGCWGERGCCIFADGTFEALTFGDMCEGGEGEAALDFIVSAGGAAMEDDYPYLGENGYCK